MPPRHPLGLLLLALVLVERAVELVVSRRNERRLRAMGAVEVGQGHYPAMVLLHVALLGATAVEGLVAPGLPAWAAQGAAATVLVTQALRWWAVATLGVRWCTRVLVLPGAPPVTGGPYRLLPHPNYLAVAVEVAALPLAAGAWRTAIVFTVANAAVLSVRIRAEEAALGEPWARAFGEERTVTEREVAEEIRRLARDELRLAWDGGDAEPLAGRLDSLALLSLVVAVEDRFRVRITEADAAGAQSLTDLARLVLRLEAGAAGAPGDAG